jgi:hypothetical protein
MENPLSKYVLFAGIAIAILKGGEVLLRKHQKEWVQTRFNNLSKWFDSKKPLAYVRTERGRNAILWWGFVVYWDGRLVSYGIRNNYRILTILGVVIFLGWLVIFRYVTVMFFELIRVETPKFRLRILTGLRERVHNFFLRWYQISIAWIILSEKSGVYIIRSFVYGLALTLVSLFYVFSVFIYLIVVMFTVLAAIDGTVPTNPLLLTGMAVSLLGAMILILFGKTLWFLLLVIIEAGVIVCSAEIVVLVSALSLLVRVFGQLIGALAENEKGAWAGLLVIVGAIVACLEAYWRFFK